MRWSLGGVPAAPRLLSGKGPFLANVTGTVPTDKVTYQDGTLEIIDGTGASFYTHTPRYRGRGNSTWAAPKKPFKVRSLNRSQRPFGMAASRDWAFMADYYDESYLRTVIAFEVYRRATGRWAPKSRHIWLEWPGATTAGGLYRYSETVDVQAGRVNIRVMSSSDTTGNALTGPYFMETDDYFDSPGFRSGLNSPTMWDTPEAPNSTQQAYITAWVDACETALVSGTSIEIASFIDLDSFVDWFLLMEFAKNFEASWFKSIKWMKDQDPPNGTGKAVMQTPWDMDLSFGKSWNDVDGGSHTGWALRQWADAGPGGTSGRPNWFYYLWNRWPAFQTAARARWSSVFVPTIAGLTPWLDGVISEIQPFIAADRALWYSGAPQGSLHTPSFVKSWVTNRAAWITANL